MRFRITSHSGSRSSTRPANAVDLLWQRLGASRDDVSFARVGEEIWATSAEDGWSRWTQDHERAAVGRLAILEIVREACEDQPELEVDWFAVGAD